MIKVNGRVFQQWEQGMTVADLIETKRFIYPRKTVWINEQMIAEEDYESTCINEGDDVKVIHLMAGG